jgi:hypothetical protein
VQWHEIVLSDCYARTVAKITDTTMVMEQEILVHATDSLQLVTKQPANSMGSATNQKPWPDLLKGMPQSPSMSRESWLE